MVKIVLLTDGKPGHETQSIGIAKLLNKAQNFEIIKITINKPKKIVQQIFKRFYNMLSKEWMLSFFLTPEALKTLNETSDLFYIVSAGGDTLLANALLKKILINSNPSLKNIIATSLRGMPESAYDVVFTTDPNKENQAPYLFYPIAPNKMVSFNLKQDEINAKNKLGLNLDQSIVSILLGADTADVKIGSGSNWLNLIKNLALQNMTQKYFVCTSRRTPELLQQELKQELSLPNVKLILFGQEQGITIQDLIFSARSIICSPDSTSMLSEAIIANKNVIVPLFQNTKLSQNFQSYYRKMNPYVMCVEAQEVNELLDSPKFQDQNHVDILQTKFVQALNLA
ncbi:MULTISPECIES: ELM1/GtrOC1 family putative glycosyltransferase [unclassified Acinetobacter]|uniref:ELM1/GtrOC1 family putative glycosyltransferase n=1 Tax=unclassified Acinetobacter TaxID=196816 RepID=UPI0015D0EDCF|nr:MULTISPECIES: ELM1/GtrOC1 family putative glycosyltransferase [unclassified Acinetobacter]UUS61301.1 mitochondrial fission ELM1 family protein [Acinetobacter sp. YH16056_T]